MTYAAHTATVASWLKSKKINAEVTLDSSAYDERPVEMRPFAQMNS